MMQSPFPICHTPGCRRWSSWCLIGYAEQISNSNPKSFYLTMKKHKNMWSHRKTWFSPPSSSSASPIALVVQLIQSLARWRQHSPAKCIKLLGVCGFWWHRDIRHLETVYPRSLNITGCWTTYWNVHPLEEYLHIPVYISQCNKG